MRTERRVPLNNLWEQKSAPKKSATEELTAGDKDLPLVILDDKEEPEQMAVPQVRPRGPSMFWANARISTPNISIYKYRMQG
jgi:hypothetical protein